MNDFSLQDNTFGIHFFFLHKNGHDHTCNKSKSGGRGIFGLVKAAHNLASLERQADATRVDHPNHQALFIKGAAANVILLGIADPDASVDGCVPEADASVREEGRWI